MKLDHVDTMRGLAILMVIFAHTGWCVLGLSTELREISSYGSFGVQLFFVASAFTLCHSGVQRRGEARPLVSYAIRRYFRIAPMYYIGILLYAGISLLNNDVIQHRLALGAEYTLPGVLANVFFVHGFIPGPANNDVVPGGWSIGTEMAFYAIFPLLFAGLLKLRAFNLRAAVLILVAALLASQAILWAVKQLTGFAVSPNNFMYFNIANQLPVFVMGMVLFFLWREDRWPIRSIWGNAAGFAAFTAAAALAMAAPNPNYSLVPALAATSFVFLFKVLEAARPLNPTWIRNVGKVSFSMYVVHFVFAYKGTLVLSRVLAPKIGSGAALVILYAFSVVASYWVAVVAQRVIEARFIGLGKRLIAWLRARAQLRKAPVPTVP
ncbi:MAG TPA: acyltransferase [Variovorax sp.]|nr:acyltransferase [Variovorax sp.]